MQTLESNKKTSVENSIDENSIDLPDFTTDSYKDACNPFSISFFVNSSLNP